MDFLKIDPQSVTQIMEQFLAAEVHKCGFDKVVLGLSGGIDSTVVAYLCARAFPPAQVHVLIMPYKTSYQKNIQHAELVARTLKINYHIFDISPMIDAFFEQDAAADVNRRGNRMARERMCILYDYSLKYRALVVGTSNKTELLLGYGTIFGDLASAINPIGDLYKTQIRQLAEYLEVPQEIIDKPPSADLWTGQTDEGEIGYSYAEIDRLLYFLVDKRYSRDMLQDLKFSIKMVKDIQNRIQKSQFKRRPPIIAKLSNRTINQDFRYCRDWGV
jgi:NAD+ synthase